MADLREKERWDRLLSMDTNLDLAQLIELEKKYEEEDLI